MTATLTPEKAIVDTGNALPTFYLWTREKYEEAVALGILGPGDKTELIEGEIFQKMPQNPPHSTALTLAQEALRLPFPTGHVFRAQLPLSVGDFQPAGAGPGCCPRHPARLQSGSTHGGALHPGDGNLG